MTNGRMSWAALAIATVLVTSACGGSDDGGTVKAGGSKPAASSTGSSGSPSASPSPTASSSSSGGGSASAKAFCDIFDNLDERVGPVADGELPTKEQVNAIKAAADDIDRLAPAEIRDAAKGIAEYFRLMADAASQGSLGAGDAERIQEALGKFGTNFGVVGTWAATNCPN